MIVLIYLPTLHLVFDYACVRAVTVSERLNSDLYGHILRLRRSHRPPARLLVVVHLVAHRLLPVDGFGL